MLVWVLSETKTFLQRMNPTHRPRAHIPGTILKHRNIPRSKVSLVSPQKNRVAPDLVWKRQILDQETVGISKSTPYCANWEDRKFTRRFWFRHYCLPLVLWPHVFLGSDYGKDNMGALILHLKVRWPSMRTLILLKPRSGFKWLLGL